MQSVEKAMRSFEEAERALDPDRLLGHFVDVPDFHIYHDGQRLTFEAMAAGVRNAFPALRSIEGGFGEVCVLALAPDAALASARFEETVTDGRGTSVSQHGAVSWLWRLIEGQWRIVYGHVDHRPGKRQE